MSDGVGVSMVGQFRVGFSNGLFGFVGILEQQEQWQRQDIWSGSQQLFVHFTVHRACLCGMTPASRCHEGTWWIIRFLQTFARGRSRRHVKLDLAWRF